MNDKRSWVEINLKTVQNNYNLYKRRLLKGQRIMAVIKADAYGHGGEQVALALQKIGCNDFAVATVQEGVKLRENGIKGNVLILGYTPISRLNEVFDKNLCQTVYCEEYAEMIIKSNLSLRVHLAIDTGMNRLGFTLKENPKLLKRYFEKLKIEGIFTHLSSADDEEKDDFTRQQIERFYKFINNLPFKVRDAHYANTSGFLRFNSGFANVVRVGVGLYGLGQNKEIKCIPVLEWKSVVVMVKTVPKGECVGYGQTYVTNSKTKVATISVGYADGYSRGLSNVGKIVINGVIARVIGKVCMDYIIADVSEIENIKIGDEVTLIGGEYLARDMAKDIGTIDYEVVTKISKRVDRVFVKRVKSGVKAKN